MKTPKLNVKLIRKIQRHITKEPRRFMMDCFGIIASTNKEWREEAQWFHDAPKSRPPCGTAACICGWANLLTGNNWESDVPNACRVLGIEQVQYAFENELFVVENWPQPFRGQYTKAKTPKQRSKIACQRLDHLIKTGE